MIHSKYIDPTTDYGFKRIFASEPNKELLISFINELFRGNKTIVDLTYDKNEYVGEIDILGSVILDLVCTTSDSKKIIIEIQRSSQLNFKRRILFYGSKAITDQAPRGGRKTWAYNISEVYVIAIMDGFPMPNSTSTDKYLHDICLCDRDSGVVFYEDLEFIYIELINFTKQESELKTDLDGWLYVLKNMSKMDKIPLYLRKPIFQKLFDIAEYSKLNKEEKAMYDTSLKRKWDNQNALDYARMQGVEKGREEGMEKGREEERAIFVRNLIAAKNFTIAEIAHLAGVEESFVVKVMNSMK